MNKRTKFLWAWNEDQPTADPHMSRERLAKLLRNWRRNVRGSLTRRRDNAFTVFQYQCGEGTRATVVLAASS